VDLWGLSASDRGYSTQKDAANAALDSINQKSIDENIEYGGLVYQNPNDGLYYHTAPISDSGLGVDPFKSPAPGDSRVVGDYHTHGDYSMPDVFNNPIRTSDPNRDGYNSDHFSSSDKTGIENDARRFEETDYRGYLGTPGHDHLEYNPYTGGEEKIN
jgi:hypothetical protein